MSDNERYYPGACTNAAYAFPYLTHQWSITHDTRLLRVRRYLHMQPWAQVTTHGPSPVPDKQQTQYPLCESESGSSIPTRSLREVILRIWRGLAEKQPERTILARERQRATRSDMPTTLERDVIDIAQVGATAHATPCANRRVFTPPPRYTLYTRICYENTR